MNNKLLSLLGIARRAGRLSLGYDSAEEAMKNGKSRLLILAWDLSERTLRILHRQPGRLIPGQSFQIYPWSGLEPLSANKSESFP